LASEGWELYFEGSSILGNRYEHKKKGHKTESSLIIRKACTKEELDAALDRGVKSKNRASEEDAASVE
jgi:hypothetical protein